MTTLNAVKNIMGDGQWHTIQEVAKRAKCPENTASATMRLLRRPAHGSNKLEKRYRYGRFEYRIANQVAPDLELIVAIAAEFVRSMRDGKA